VAPREKYSRPWQYANGGFFYTLTDAGGENDQ